MNAIKRILARKWVAITVLSAIVLTALGGTVLGKYLHDEKHASLADTTPFYFTCNFEDGGIYYLSGTKAEITLTNHDGLKHFTPDDIKYTVAVTAPDGNSVEPKLKTDDAELTGNTEDSATYEFTGDAGGFYKVTVQSTAPYEKTISFQISFMEPDVETCYSITVAESNNWLRLDLYVGATLPANDITIVYGTLSPDNTNEMMSDWLTGTNEAKSGTVSIKSLTDHSHYSFIFFGNVAGYTNVDKAELTESTITLLGTQGEQS